MRPVEPDEIKCWLCETPNRRPLEPRPTHIHCVNPHCGARIPLRPTPFERLFNWLLREKRPLA